jgi:lipoprotein-anchoring transpeptidase ErfK/SrfK
MRRTRSRFARVGLVSLAVPLLALHGNSPMPVNAVGPRAHVGWTSTSVGGAGAGTLEARGLQYRVGAASRQLEVQELVPLGARPASAPKRPRIKPSLLVRLKGALQARARPGSGKVVGVVPRGSKYYGVPTVAWVLQVSPDGRYGKVPIPYSRTRKTGWIPLRGLKRSYTPYVVRADLSAHQITVRKRGRLLFRIRAATGAPRSPTPPGLYFVTDRVPFNPRGSLGAFAFGISGIQTRLPPGWGGGNQLAIHGTNNPSSIGRSVSAGCLRVSRAALERLKPILLLGTPVIIQP